jgi:hypothetical protein
MNVPIFVMSAMSRSQIQGTHPAAYRRAMPESVDYGLPLEPFALADF